MINYFVLLSKFSIPIMKTISYWLIALLLCLVTALHAQEVKISMDHPDQVNAGEVFEVTVTISKGSLTDYSRFSQDLPAGLTATNVNSPNADFSFDDQRIRIIWLKLPVEQEVKVTYNILVDKRLKGSFVLGGVFAYVVEEERKFLNFERSSEITIIPNPNVDPALVVDIRDFEKVVAETPVVKEEEPEVVASVIRQKPVLEGSGSYLVRLLIQNPTGSKYAKIEETIPSGYLFESVDPHEGIESFASSTVKFIWMKLPSEPEFQVDYRLVPQRDKSQGKMAITGIMTYSIGNENRQVDIKEMDVALEQLSLAQKRNLLLTGQVPAGVGRAPETASTQAPPARRTTPEPVKKEPAGTPPTASSGKTISNTAVLAAGQGLYFRVQLSANRRPFDARTFYRRAGVDQEVKVEEHEGLYKYTAGSFTVYSQADSYKKKLLKLPGVKDAFVVAYRDGKRVPVPSQR